MTVVIDASVAVKWYAAEIGWEAARRILDGPGPLIAPSHILAEAGRGPLRHRRAGALTDKDVADAFSGLRTAITLIPIESLTETAFNIALAASVTIYDALYVAAATELDCKLVTADRRLVVGLSASRWSMRALLLEQWDDGVGRAAPDEEDES